MSSEKREASPEASPLKGPAPKAVPEDTSDVVFEDGIPLSPMAADQSVQFISGTPANGDAKVEIGEGGAPTFVGLGKEELMKYANDPFWIRLRWFLFILFWVLWIAMLAGAIVIIILAPRCAEKKNFAETIYQIKASELGSNNKLDEQLVADLASLKEQGLETVVITDLLQHDPNEPEAVTNFDKIDSSIDESLFSQAIEKLRSKGLKILLQLVPNHSGTSHEWFNDTNFKDFYIRRPYDDVKQSVWTMVDGNINAWTQDPQDQSSAYLQQFKGNLADLNFQNNDVVSKFKRILSGWKDKKIDGFVISKASYLVEDLNSLMVHKNSTKNRPENVKVVTSIVGGPTASSGSVLVELDDPSAETLKQYIDNGLKPVVKSIDTSKIEEIRETLEGLSENPEAIINLSKSRGQADKVRLANMLAIAGGSHALISHDSSSKPDDKKFLQELVKFQQNNPRGKSASFKHIRNGEVVTTLRSDGEDHLIVANFGGGRTNFNPKSLNLTETSGGKVVLATPNASQKPGDTVEDVIDLNQLSGVVIQLKKPEETSS